MRKKIYATFVIICWSVSGKSFAKKHRHHHRHEILHEVNGEEKRNKNFDKINTLSFYSGYINEIYTNHNLANFGLELANLGDLGFYKIINYSKNNYLNSIFGVTGGFLALYLHIIHNVAYHELGHALRAKALGLDYTLGLQRYHSTPTCKNFFIFFISNVFKGGMDGVTHSQYPIKNNPTFWKMVDTQLGILISAGGTNNSMYLAERNFEARCENKLRKNFFTNVAYLGEKLEPFLYLFFFSNGQRGDDFSSLLRGYKMSKINVTKSHYKTAETISLLSGLINSGIELFLSDKFNNFFQHFITPDIFVYSTTYGLSYKFVTGYKFREMSLLRVGWEHVMHGENKNEFSLGAFHRFDNELKPEASGTIYFGCKGVNLEISLAFFLLEHLKLSSGVTLCATRSLFGERHATSICDIKETIKEIEEANSKNKTISEDHINGKYLKNKYTANIWAGVSWGF